MNSGNFNSALSDPHLNVMNYLNQVVLSFPHSVSFASGRPSENFFDIDEWPSCVDEFVAYESERTGRSPGTVMQDLGQYGRTIGIINDLIVRTLENDEGIRVHASDVMVTSGCQEGMALCLDTLFRVADDVLLVTDPTYIGVTGLAKIRGIETRCVSCDAEGPELSDLNALLSEIRKNGKTPKALYLIPDFNNPLGTSISLPRRQALLQCCADAGVYILEDNPYGMFRFEGDRLPTLKALDSFDIVIYLGTFSKTISPGLRVGYLVATRKVTLGDETGSLTQQLSKIKSLLTVNTGQLSQAIVGGILLREKCSLQQRVAPIVQYYKNNRDVMVQALSDVFSKSSSWGSSVRWNYPSGGYFLTVSLPFTFGAREAEVCARDYGVICMPLSFFSMNGSCDNVIRLSFSYVSPAQITLGVNRLGCYIDAVMDEHRQSMVLEG